MPMQIKSKTKGSNHLDLILRPKSFYATQSDRLTLICLLGLDFVALYMLALFQKLLEHCHHYLWLKRTELNPLITYKFIHLTNPHSLEMLNAFCKD